MDKLDEALHVLEAREPPHGMSKAAWKRLLKEALREIISEWLDAKTIEFRKWSFRWLFAAGVAAVCYFILTHSGWQRVP